MASPAALARLVDASDASALESTRFDQSHRAHCSREVTPVGCQMHEGEKIRIRVAT